MADKSEANLDGKSLQSLRVVDLRLALEKRGLPKGGSKKELVERLKLQLKIEKLHEESAKAEDHVPNLNLQDELTGQNDFVKQYLAAQQQTYAMQLKERRLAEMQATTPEPEGCQEAAASPVVLRLSGRHQECWERPGRTCSSSIDPGGTAAGHSPNRGEPPVEADPPTEACRSRLRQRRPSPPGPIKRGRMKAAAKQQPQPEPRLVNNQEECRPNDALQRTVQSPRKGAVAPTVSPPPTEERHEQRYPSRRKRQLSAGEESGRAFEAELTVVTMTDSDQHVAEACQAAASQAVRAKEKHPGRPPEEQQTWHRNTRSGAKKALTAVLTSSQDSSAEAGALAVASKKASREQLPSQLPPKAVQVDSTELQNPVQCPVVGGSEGKEKPLRMLIRKTGTTKGIISTCDFVNVKHDALPEKPLEGHQNAHSTQVPCNVESRPAFKPSVHKVNQLESKKTSTSGHFSVAQVGDDLHETLDKLHITTEADGCQSKVGSVQCDTPLVRAMAGNDATESSQQVQYDISPKSNLRISHCAANTDNTSTTPREKDLESAAIQDTHRTSPQMAMPAAQFSLEGAGAACRSTATDTSNSPSRPAVRGPLTAAEMTSAVESILETTDQILPISEQCHEVPETEANFIDKHEVDSATDSLLKEMCVQAEDDEILPLNTICQTAEANTEEIMCIQHVDKASPLATLASSIPSDADKGSGAGDRNFNPAAEPPHDTLGLQTDLDACKAGDTILPTRQLDPIETSTKDESCGPGRPPEVSLPQRKEGNERKRKAEGDNSHSSFSQKGVCLQKMQMQSNAKDTAGGIFLVPCFEDAASASSLTSTEDIGSLTQPPHHRKEEALDDTTPSESSTEITIPVPETVAPISEHKKTISQRETAERSAEKEKTAEISPPDTHSTWCGTSVSEAVGPFSGSQQGAKQDDGQKTEETHQPSECLNFTKEDEAALEALHATVVLEKQVPKPAEPLSDLPPLQNHSEAECGTVVPTERNVADEMPDEISRLKSLSTSCGTSSNELSQHFLESQPAANQYDDEKIVTSNQPSECLDFARNTATALAGLQNTALTEKEELKPVESSSNLSPSLEYPDVQCDTVAVAPKDTEFLSQEESEKKSAPNEISGENACSTSAIEVVGPFSESQQAAKEGDSKKTEATKQPSECLCFSNEAVAAPASLQNVVLLEKAVLKPVELSSDLSPALERTDVFCDNVVPTPKDKSLFQAETAQQSAEKEKTGGSVLPDSSTTLCGTSVTEVVRPFSGSQQAAIQDDGQNTEETHQPSENLDFANEAAVTPEDAQDAAVTPEGAQDVVHLKNEVLKLVQSSSDISPSLEHPDALGDTVVNTPKDTKFHSQAESPEETIGEISSLETLSTSGTPATEVSGHFPDSRPAAKQDDNEKTVTTNEPSQCLDFANATAPEDLQNKVPLETQVLNEDRGSEPLSDLSSSSKHPDALCSTVALSPEDTNFLPQTHGAAKKMTGEISSLDTLSASFGTSVAEVGQSLSGGQQVAKQDDGQKTEAAKTPSECLNLVSEALIAPENVQIMVPLETEGPKQERAAQLSGGSLSALEDPERLCDTPFLLASLQETLNTETEVAGKEAPQSQGDISDISGGNSDMVSHQKNNNETLKSTKLPARCTVQEEGSCHTKRQQDAETAEAMLQSCCDDALIVAEAHIGRPCSSQPAPTCKQNATSVADNTPHMHHHTSFHDRQVQSKHSSEENSSHTTEAPCMASETSAGEHSQEEKIKMETTQEELLTHSTRLPFETLVDDSNAEKSVENKTVMTEEREANEDAELSCLVGTSDECQSLTKPSGWSGSPSAYSPHDANRLKEEPAQETMARNHATPAVPENAEGNAEIPTHKETPETMDEHVSVSVPHSVHTEDHKPQENSGDTAMISVSDNAITSSVPVVATLMPSKSLPADVFAPTSQMALAITPESQNACISEAELTVKDELRPYHEGASGVGCCDSTTGSGTKPAMAASLCEKESVDIQSDNIPALCASEMTCNDSHVLPAPDSTCLETDVPTRTVPQHNRMSAVSHLCLPLPASGQGSWTSDVTSDSVHQPFPANDNSTDSFPQTALEGASGQYDEYMLTVGSEQHSESVTKTPTMDSSADLRYCANSIISELSGAANVGVVIHTKAKLDNEGSSSNVGDCRNSSRLPNLGTIDVEEDTGSAADMSLQDCNLHGHERGAEPECKLEHGSRTEVLSAVVHPAHEHGENETECETVAVSIHMTTPHSTESLSTAMQSPLGVTMTCNNTAKASLDKEEDDPTARGKESKVNSNNESKQGGQTAHGVHHRAEGCMQQAFTRAVIEPILCEIKSTSDGSSQGSPESSPPGNHPGERDSHNKQNQDTMQEDQNLGSRQATSNASMEINLHTAETSIRTPKKCKQANLSTSCDNWRASLEVLHEHFTPPMESQVQEATELVSHTKRTGREQAEEVNVKSALEVPAYRTTPNWRSEERPGEWENSLKRITDDGQAVCSEVETCSPAIQMHSNDEKTCSERDGTSTPACQLTKKDNAQVTDTEHIGDLQSQDYSVSELGAEHGPKALVNVPLISGPDFTFQANLFTTTAGFTAKTMASKSLCTSTRSSGVEGNPTSLVTDATGRFFDLGQEVTTPTGSDISENSEQSTAVCAGDGNRRSVANMSKNSNTGSEGAPRPKTDDDMDVVRPTGSPSAMKPEVSNAPDSYADISSLTGSALTGSVLDRQLVSDSNKQDPMAREKLDPFRLNKDTICTSACLHNDTVSTPYAVFNIFYLR